jgi:hypothetical protein
MILHFRKGKQEITLSPETVTVPAGSKESAPFIITADETKCHPGPTSIFVKVDKGKGNQNDLSKRMFEVQGPLLTQPGEAKRAKGQPELRGMATAIEAPPGVARTTVCTTLARQHDWDAAAPYPASAPTNARVSGKKAVSCPSSSSSSNPLPTSVQRNKSKPLSPTTSASVEGLPSLSTSSSFSPTSTNDTASSSAASSKASPTVSTNGIAGSSTASPKASPTAPTNGIAGSADSITSTDRDKFRLHAASSASSVSTLFPSTSMRSSDKKEMGAEDDQDADDEKREKAADDDKARDPFVDPQREDYCLAHATNTLLQLKGAATTKDFADASNKLTRIIKDTLGLDPDEAGIQFHNDSGNYNLEVAIGIIRRNGLEAEPWDQLSDQTAPHLDTLDSSTRGFLVGSGTHFWAITPKAGYWYELDSLDPEGRKIVNDEDLRHISKVRTVWRIFLEGPPARTGALKVAEEPICPIPGCIGTDDAKVFHCNQRRGSDNAPCGEPAGHTVCLEELYVQRGDGREHSLIRCKQCAAQDDNWHRRPPATRLSVRKDHADASTRACDKCTYTNDGAATCCKMCNAPMPMPGGPAHRHDAVTLVPVNVTVPIGGEAITAALRLNSSTTEAGPALITITIAGGDNKGHMTVEPTTITVQRGEQISPPLTIRAAATATRGNTLLRVSVSETKRRGSDLFGDKRTFLVAGIHAAPTDLVSYPMPSEEEHDDHDTSDQGTKAPDPGPGSSPRDISRPESYAGPDSSSGSGPNVDGDPGSGKRAKEGGESVAPGPEPPQLALTSPATIAIGATLVGEKNVSFRITQAMPTPRQTLTITPSYKGLTFFPASVQIQADSEESDLFEIRAGAQTPQGSIALTITVTAGTSGDTYTAHVRGIELGNYIRCFLNRQKREGRWMYEVAWDGYPDNEATWELSTKYVGARYRELLRDLQARLAKYPPPARVEPPDKSSGDPANRSATTAAASRKANTDSSSHTTNLDEHSATVDPTRDAPVQGTKQNREMKKLMEEDSLGEKRTEAQCWEAITAEAQKEARHAEGKEAERSIMTTRSRSAGIVAPMSQHSTKPTKAKLGNRWLKTDVPNFAKVDKPSILRKMGRTKRNNNQTYVSSANMADLKKTRNLLPTEIMDAATASLASTVTIIDDDAKHRVMFVNNILSTQIMHYRKCKKLNETPKRVMTDVEWLVAVNADKKHGYVVAFHILEKKALVIDSWTDFSADRDDFVKGIWEWAQAQEGCALSTLLPPQMVKVNAYQQDELEMNCFLFASLYTVMTLVACAQHTEPEVCASTIERWMRALDGDTFDSEARTWLVETIESGEPIAQHASEMLDRVGLREVLDSTTEGKDGDAAALGLVSPSTAQAKEMGADPRHEDKDGATADAEDGKAKETEAEPDADYANAAAAAEGGQAAEGHASDSAAPTSSSFGPAR